MQITFIPIPILHILTQYYAKKTFFIVFRTIPGNSYFLIYFNALNVNNAVSRDYLQI